jgi:hypothetical protein
VAIASFKPSWASEMTSLTPDNPRALRPRRNATHPAVLARHEVNAQNLTAAIRIDAGCDNAADVDDSSTFAALDDECVEPQVGVGAGIERPVSELGDDVVEALSELGHLRLRDACRGGGRSPNSRRRWGHMARPRPTNQAEWEREGAEAILDLVNEEVVVPIPAIEAQIAVRGWKEFHKVQPVQLTGARRRLLAEGLIEEDTSHQHPAVTTARIPIPAGRKREIERLRGNVRKSYRRYLSWSGDHLHCGKHAEKVVLDSLREAASDAGLYVPPQAIGNVREVHGATLPGALTLDAQADILRLPEVAFGAALVIEVKNIHSWIYPSARELWELLVKAAPLTKKLPVVPLLVCARTAYPAGQMAKDLGFFLSQMSNQIFSPSIDEGEFNDIIRRFGLAI